MKIKQWPVIFVLVSVLLSSNIVAATTTTEFPVIGKTILPANLEVRDMTAYDDQLTGLTNSAVGNFSDDMSNWDSSFYELVSNDTNNYRVAILLTAISNSDVAPDISKLFQQKMGMGEQIAIAVIKSKVPDFITDFNKKMANVKVTDSKGNNSVVTIQILQIDGPDVNYYKSVNEADLSVRMLISQQNGVLLPINGLIHLTVQNSKYAAVVLFNVDSEREFWQGQFKSLLANRQ